MCSILLVVAFHNQSHIDICVSLSCQENHLLDGRFCFGTSSCALTISPSDLPHCYDHCCQSRWSGQSKLPGSLQPGNILQFKDGWWVWWNRPFGRASCFALLTLQAVLQWIKVARLQREFCTKVFFFEPRIFLRKMLRNFPRNFWAFVLWVRKNLVENSLQISH